VDCVVARFLFGVRPGLGVYCVANWYLSAFRPGLGDIADKAERETMAGSTGPLAVASGDLFSLASAIFRFKSILNLVASEQLKAAGIPRLVILKRHRP
jgi:hypothetical protein